MTAPLPVVFLGPTLSVAEASNIADAVYLPPATQGAILTAVRRHDASAILIIDGVFQSEPAVRHKEILWALDRGIAVLGAASMGALRAAELDRFGMVGVGLIYRWYRRWPGAPDDAVAVVHTPPELGAQALTVALIDLLMTIRRGSRLGVIDAGQRSLLEKQARALNFRDRTLANVAAAGRLEAGRLAACLVEQKKQDAVAALRHLGKVNPPPRRNKFVWTTNFVRDLEHAKIPLPDDATFPTDFPHGRFVP
ncbi:TfuA domain-containing protein [Nordella sp. HKS 07]|uniref:TfuA-like protein n=1 Tax=Nordella sp. HKS 07 TaxID=2712222 RepID=UPI0013E12515|nr:TfuA-like protein [Nordella sp. HKS 07]QIG48320.1 TfuA domain-containing protein [Nordella sp. HKS 07]